MKVLLSGASGLIGKALGSSWVNSGHSLTALVRRPQLGKTILWNPDIGTIDKIALEGFDAVIHLGGENIAGGRWTAARKKRLMDSRVRSTRLLSETLAQLKQPPRVFLCASAVGFYGDRDEEVVTETSAAGNGFLSEICQAWETAANGARQRDLRVINLRFGVVLSPERGALAKMLPAFRLGLGGRLGRGDQWMSWIAIDDVVGIINYALTNETLSGPVNVVAPAPVRNKDFTQTLAAVLHRPAFIPAPIPFLKIIFGKEMVNATLLASTRALPQKILESGYSFRFPGLHDALEHHLLSE